MAHRTRTHTVWVLWDATRHSACLSVPDYLRVPITSCQLPAAPVILRYFGF